MGASDFLGAEWRVEAPVVQTGGSKGWDGFRARARRRLDRRRTGPERARHGAAAARGL